MFLIVGLGNPGRKYALTRHNIGFMVVDQLVDKLNSAYRKNLKYFIASASIDNIKIRIIKPMTYMNLSGQAVNYAIQKYDIELSRSLIICDDINLPFGTIRIRSKGSDGGQKGLRSIIASLGTQNIPRLRIGIGNSDKEASDYVLSPFKNNEKKELPLIINQAIEATLFLIRNDIELAMSRFNKNHNASI